MKLCYSFTEAFKSRFIFTKSVYSILIGFITTLPALQAQQLVINKGSSLVLNGKVNLVINNASLKNDGNFSAGRSTVHFSGHEDQGVSFVAGHIPTTFNNLTIKKSASGLALNSPVVIKDVLTMEKGNLYTDSNLTLRSDEYLTARVAAVDAGSSIIGKTNVERYVPEKRAWRLMTAPVTASNTIYNSWQNKGVYEAGIGMLVTGPNPGGKKGNGLDVSALNTISMKGWNHTTQSFANVTNTHLPISAGTNGAADNTAYFVFVRGDRNPANTNAANSSTTTLTSIGSLQTGDQLFEVSPYANKYTLVGNPYAAPVDFNKLKRKNVMKRFYVWDPSLNSVGGYVMLDDLNDDGIFVKTVHGSPQNTLLQSSQAFFVQTLTNAPASILFTENSKSVNEVSGMFRPVNAAAHGNGHIITTLHLLEGGNKTILADGVIAEFDNLYSAAVDNDDAIKFSNTNENIIIVRNNSLLSAERRPALTITDTVYFRLTSTTKRKYQFAFEVSGLATTGLMGFLEDSYLGTRTPVNLAGTTTVNFEINTSAASANANRFKMVFANISIVLPVTITQVTAVASKQNIEVSWKVENEINIDRYVVETSTNGISFNAATTIRVTGSNNSLNNYSWLDVNPVAGTNYYRVKSFDQSGEVKYSAIVKANMDNLAGGYNIYPNPVTNNNINLVMSAQPAGIYQVRLTNVTGQVILTKTLSHAGGNSTHSVNTGAKLAAGMYQLSILEKDNLQNTLKVIVK